MNLRLHARMAYASDIRAERPGDLHSECARASRRTVHQDSMPGLIRALAGTAPSKVSFVVNLAALDEGGLPSVTLHGKR